MGDSPELETSELHGSRKLHGARNWTVGCYRSPWRDDCLKRSDEEASV